MTKIEVTGMIAEIVDGCWVSEYKGFEKWLNAFCSEEILIGYYPQPEAGMLNAAKNFFKNLKELEAPKPPTEDAGDIVH